MFADLALILELGIGVLFAVSAIAKALRPREFADGVREYGLLPDLSTLPVALLIILTEAAIAVSHIAGLMLKQGILAAVVFLLAALTAVSVALHRGLSVKCLCFGAASAEPVSRVVVVRVCLLLGAEVLLYVGIMAADAPTRFADLDVLDQMLAGACSILLLILINWTSRVSDVVALFRDGDCRSSQRREEV